jgi:hypothetical protein
MMYHYATLFLAVFMSTANADDNGREMTRLATDNENMTSQTKPPLSSPQPRVKLDRIITTEEVNLLNKLKLTTLKNLNITY